MAKVPGVNHRDAARAFQKAGFRVLREGKHIVMGGIVPDAGLTVAEFRKLLGLQVAMDDALLVRVVHRKHHVTQDPRRPASFTRLASFWLCGADPRVISWGARETPWISQALRDW